jgi:hypothetical protein
VEQELLLTLPEHMSSHPRFKWDSCCLSRPTACHHVFSSMLGCLLWLPRKNNVSFVFIPFVFRRLCFYSFFVLIYTFQYQVTSGTGTAWVPEFTPDFSRVMVVRSSVFCVVFCTFCYIILSFFIWPLYCLCFSDLRLPITPLESLNCFCLFD